MNDSLKYEIWKDSNIYRDEQQMVMNLIIFALLFEFSQFKNLEILAIVSAIMIGIYAVVILYLLSGGIFKFADTIQKEQYKKAMDNIKLK